MEVLFSIVLAASLTILCPTSAVESETLLWPAPRKLSTLSERVRLLEPNKFFFSSSSNSALLHEALQRYMVLLFQKPAPFYPDGASVNVQEAMPALNVEVLHEDETLDEDTDESYTLDTQIGILSAVTVYGVLRGLETFSQLTYRNALNQFLINDVAVSDGPRFKFRAAMIDTSNHFLPLQTILDHLDAMAYSKFNVLHWHIVDDQSFPYTSIKFPNLAKGAFDENHCYSQADIAQVIHYARFRGIRVVVEFDTPAHMSSWGVGQPGLLTQCYSDGKPNGDYGPINPILDTTWSFLDDFFGEVSQVFPDKYFHLGGDEVDFPCWHSNPGILEWMKRHNLSDYSKLEQFYEQKLLNLLSSLGKRSIVWQDMFDDNVQLRSDTIVNVWKKNWLGDVLKVTATGLNVILSSCWYLDLISYGADWKSYYTCDPQDFNGTSAQKDLVIGGGACLWAEYVDATNFLSRFWPRGCAAAERLWSAAEHNNVSAASPRLHNMRCRLISRQIPAEPIGPSYCSHEWNGDTRTKSKFN